MQRLTVLGAELPMLFLHIHYKPLTLSQFHISPSPLSRHPPQVPNPPHQDLSLDLAIPLPPFHKSVYRSCPFDLGERPSCLLVLYSDEDVDYLQTRFLLPNLLKPRYADRSIQITTHLGPTSVTHRQSHQYPTSDRRLAAQRVLIDPASFSDIGPTR